MFAGHSTSPDPGGPGPFFFTLKVPVYFVSLSSQDIFPEGPNPESDQESEATRHFNMRALTDTLHVPEFVEGLSSPVAAGQLQGVGHERECVRVRHRIHVGLEVGASQVLRLCAALLSRLQGAKGFFPFRKLLWYLVQDPAKRRKLQSEFK